MSAATLAPPRAKRQFVIVRDIDADAPTAFEALISESGMKAWIPLCKSAVWQHRANAQGPGIGSVREILLAGGITANERIVAWQPGRELHYSFDRTTLPIAALTRNYVGVTRIEPAGRDRSRLTWAVHFDTPGVLQLSRPLVIASLWPLIARMSDSLKAEAERR